MKKLGKYKVLSDIEHVLLRPTMYIGEVSPISLSTFIFDLKDLHKKEINLELFVYKMFDEILTNAIDESKKNSKLDTIKIDINPPLISIEDNGGIPVVEFEKDIYLPEVLFSQLRAGSNFDQQEVEVTGTYGVGASLVNIFSKEFEVQTSLDGKLFIGKWRDNSRSKEIQITSSKRNYTKVSFILDETKIKYEMNLDTIQFLYRRVFDFSYQANHVKFILNGIELPKIESFQEYCSKFGEIDYIYDSNKFKFCLFSPETKINESYVNGNLTINHGNHVKYFLKELQEAFPESIRSLVKPNNISFLVSLNTKEPLYSSQDKYTFIGKNFPNLYLKKQELLETETFKYLESLKNLSSRQELEKAIKKIKKSSIPHYFEATSKKDKILFITEGESAALAGKSVRSSNMAFYSLRGKFINTTASEKKLSKNEEFKNLSFILKNEDFDKIVIMTDLDYDGNAIAALLINFFYSYFPEIAENKLYRFISPLIKADNDYFFSIEDFKKANKKYKEIKYCKGLGSFTTKDFKVFFQNLNKDHLLLLKVDKKTPAMLQNLFSKSAEAIEWRKKWISQ